VGISLAVQAVLDGTFGSQVFDSTVVASLVLASAECLTPAPLTLAGVTPDSGPTDGGQTVTITGTGFTTGTAVSFGGVPATDVVVDPTGTSLTAVTPKGAAGGTTITVTTSSGASATLAYTYVAPVAPVVPATLAATGGTDPRPGLAVGGAVLALGAPLFAVDAFRRRRSA
jgi:hypothetical protein